MVLKFKVDGMTCAACSARVEKVTSHVSGVQKAEVNLLAGTMIVEAENDTVIPSVIKAVHDAGYEASVPGKESVKANIAESPLREMKFRVLFSAMFLVVLMYFTMGHMVGLPAPDWYHGSHNAMIAVLLQFFLTLSIVYLNRSYFTKGLKSLVKGAPNMDSLIAVGSGAALVYGIVALFQIAHATARNDWDVAAQYSENLYFESAAMILTLITLGKYLETRAKGKTSDAVRQLMDLSPKVATVLADGQEFVIPIEEVKPGDIVIVRSGGSIPLDGIVINGRGAVDQSAITGESIPVDKSVGDSVVAATINAEGYMQIRVQKVGDDTTLSQVIRMVEQAGASKAPIARLADKIAGVFVPVVMSIAAATLILWLCTGQSIEFSLTMAISVLVISCPCALGLATPVAIMVGTGRGASMGLLFKNAESLENLHKVNTVVLDKTGTLTVGKPAVTDILPAALDASQLLSVAAAIEARSEHPFAKAIIERNGNSPYSQAESFETLPGRGVSAIINGVKYYAGNRRLMLDLGVVVPEYAELAQQGKTPLYFITEDKTYLGAIVAADVLKEDSLEAVSAMCNMYLHVVMLTGDNHMTAKSIASRCGIEHIISDVLPADKSVVIQQLRDEGRNVLMVGDGINDAPALVTADVGMAIGAGTDIAIEAADIVLMKNSLTGVSDAIALSRVTMRNIRQNLFWAFFYNSLGIPIAAGALFPLFGIQLSPMIGAAAMSLSSVFVVTNALRLRFFKARKQKDSKLSPKETVIMETVIKVDGMMCTHCKARVESVCKAVPGVTDAVVDLQAKQVTVSGNASVEVLKEAIAGAGYDVIG